MHSSPVSEGLVTQYQGVEAKVLARDQDQNVIQRQGYGKYRHVRSYLIIPFINRKPRMPANFDVTSFDVHTSASVWD